MKKFLIAAIAVLGFTTANAQYTAEAGDIQTSVSFRPLANGQDGKEMFENVGINASYFLTDKDAIRVNLNFGSDSGKENDVKNSQTDFGFAVGYENHFKTYDRIDLFAGVEAGFATRSRKYAGHKVEGGYTSFGAGIFTGINFYVYKKLYIGTEIGFNYAHYNYNKYDAQDYEGNWVKVDPKTSNNSIKFEVEPMLKLGWTF